MEIEALSLILGVLFVIAGVVVVEVEVFAVVVAVAVEVVVVVVVVVAAAAVVVAAAEEQEGSLSPAEVTWAGVGEGSKVVDGAEAGPCNEAMASEGGPVVVGAGPSGLGAELVVAVVVEAAEILFLSFSSCSRKYFRQN